MPNLLFPRLLQPSPLVLALSLTLLLLLHSSTSVHGWQLWESPILNASSPSSPSFNGSYPPARDGATMHYYNGTLILFGGRGPETSREHIPKTYAVQKVNGSLSFLTYDQKVVKACTSDVAAQLNGTSSCSMVLTGILYNDLWMYDSRSCSRGWDGGCAAGGGAYSTPSALGGWISMDTGAALGGCVVSGVTLTCSHPCERFMHSSTLFADGRLLVYGGFSALCEDYCGDLWSMDVRACLAAMDAAAVGGSGGASSSTPSPTACTAGWRQLDAYSAGNTLQPSKRWRAASASNASTGLWVLFGGHRLWQGFALDNAATNLWNSTALIEWGGYMDDLWVMRYTGQEASLVSSQGGGWKQVVPMESCFLAPPSADYKQRHDIVCHVIWPSSRASAALALAERASSTSSSSSSTSSSSSSSSVLYMHGGFRVSYPYPTVNSPGAGLGTTALGRDGDAPFPTLPYFLDDLWRYDFGTGLWKELKPLSAGGVNPAGRFSASLFLQGSVLVLFGGEGMGGNFRSDTWLYNIESNWWIEKKTFVWPLYTPTCGSDIVAAGSSASSGTPPAPPTTGVDASRVWTQDGQLIVGASVAGEPTRCFPLDGVNGRASLPVLVPQPRRRAPGWDGCRDRADGRTDLPQELQWLQPSQRGGAAAAQDPDKQLLFIFGGVGPAAQVLELTNVSYPGEPLSDLWALDLSHCASNCSNQGLCVAGFCVCNTGFYGIDCSNVSCAGTLCTYHPETFQTDCLHCSSLPYVHLLRELLVDPTVNLREAYRLVFPAQEVGPGLTFDATSNLPKDVYAALSRKVDITLAALPNSDARTRFLLDPYVGGQPSDAAARAAAAERLAHGVCDGFGQCQCAPPYLGDDCSILDCPNACSGNGICSMEYPVARCLCTPPFSGPDCSQTICPNGCSAPNGVCTGGVCVCAMMQNPYDNNLKFMAFGGDDCSYVMPFAGDEEGRQGRRGYSLLGAAMLLISTIIMLMG